jgi:hypothetical protein
MTGSSARAVQESVAQALLLVGSAQLDAIQLPDDVDPYAPPLIQRALADAHHHLVAAFYGLAALDGSIREVRS